eukprot:7612252-Pyramimonas_sp.AAC.1
MPPSVPGRVSPRVEAAPRHASGFSPPPPLAPGKPQSPPLPAPARLSRWRSRLRNPPTQPQSKT